MRYLVVLLLTPVTMIFRGWAVSTLWNWFVVGLGEHIAQMGIAQGIGLALLVSMFTSFLARETDPKLLRIKPDGYAVYAEAASPIIRQIASMSISAMAVLTGWVVLWVQAQGWRFV